MYAIRSYYVSVIIQANVDQDRITGQFGHDEFHFDNNAFEKTYAYIEEQRALVVSSLKSGDAYSGALELWAPAHKMAEVER